MSATMRSATSDASLVGGPACRPDARTAQATTGTREGTPDTARETTRDAPSRPRSRCAAWCRSGRRGVRLPGCPTGASPSTHRSGGMTNGSSCPVAACAKLPPPGCGSDGGKGNPMRPACVEAVMAPVRTGLRRGRITTLTAAVVCLTVVTALLAAAPPAAAATRIAVDAGWAGGDYVPGRPLPVRVDITADRLLTGSLHVAIGGDPVESVTLPVEVPGGTTKRFVVVLAGPPQGDFEVTARVSGGDEGSGTAFISSV